MARARPKHGRKGRRTGSALWQWRNERQLAAAVWLAIVTICAAQTPPLFNVKDYGAVGDGAAIDTPAINNAIIAANAAGGGTVVFPAGNYLSVSIHLSNNVTLYLSNSAVILSATNG